MPEENNKEGNLSKEPMVDLDTSGPGASVDLPEIQKEEEKTYEKEEKKMKQMLRTMISPLIHLRNLVSSQMFEIARTLKNQKVVRLNKKLLKKGVISNQITLGKLKNILKELRKE